MFKDRTFDYKKEHKEIDNDGKRTFCTHCNKTLAEGAMQSHSMFMGSVYVKENLPCKPYEPLTN